MYFSSSFKINFILVYMLSHTYSKPAIKICTIKNRYIVTHFEKLYQTIATHYNTLSKSDHTIAIQTENIRPHRSY